MYWLAGELFSRLVYTSIPFAFLWILARRFGPKTRRGEGTAKSSLFAWLALAVVASAFPRADTFHVLSVYPVVVLLLFVLSARGADEPRGSRRLWAVGSGVALLLAICLVLNANYRAHLSHRVRLPRAEVWVDPSEAWIEPLVTYVSKYVQPNERIFVYGHEAQLYFLTGRFFPWRYSQLYPGQEGEDGGIALTMKLAMLPPKLVLRGVLAWPGVPDLVEFAPALEHYIVWHFEVDQDFFVDHPVPGGNAPPNWVISVMRPLPPEPTAP